MSESELLQAANPPQAVKHQLGLGAIQAEALEIVQVAEHIDWSALPAFDQSNCHHAHTYHTVLCSIPNKLKPVFGNCTHTHTHTHALKELGDSCYSQGLRNT